ncbi:MAG: FAD-binding protein [Gemmatimonadota bacterium]
MRIEFDVAVLGAGIAGSAAALAAAHSGARVAVITGPPGATAMFSGAWRGGCPDALRAALAGTGYVLRAVDAPLPHPCGQRIHCAAAAASHAGARLAEAHVVGIAGLTGFHAGSLARQWRAHSHATVQLEQTPAAGWAPVSLAAFIERASHSVVTALAAAAADFSTIILPAVLGVRHDGALHAELQTALGCTIGEALGTPPSLPGWRLHNALRAALAAAQVQVIEARAGGCSANGRAHELELPNGDVVRARSFVLATGKYAAGGIDANGAFREPAFGCPVWVDHLGETFDVADSLMLTDPARTEDQPLLRAGVHVDARQRPVNRGGDVVYQNVFVAGSIRAGWSAATHGSGAAAQDGWNAGLEAVRA